ncbi:polyphosphate kinase 1 [Longibacter salinarum]|uniref:Polyphosphate kinase n=1 Tax=Longibacter salinarum TaxID=1850348 RepID=A0A2A8D376_9BACT|nr:polyphosphate kinase 1 [Longibacter salinarum]
MEAGASRKDPRLFFNRELSTLDFNWRVLCQALDDRTPLMERVFFTAITDSNVDEFFRKRVGGLKRQQAAGVSATSPDGRTPDEQIEAVRAPADRLYRRMTGFWKDELVPLLAKEADIHILDYDDLSEGQRQKADEHFQNNIFPILTPLAVGPGHPFPFLSNLSLSLAVTLRNPTRNSDHFARVKVPSNRDRWVDLGDDRYVPLEQVIANNLGDLFRGMEIKTVHAFRVTRNADIRRDEEEADDLLEMISEELRERRFARVVRLEVDDDMPDDVRDLLTDELSIEPGDVYVSQSLLGLGDAMNLMGIDRPDLKFEPWEPVTPPRLLREGNPTDLVRQGKTADYPNIFAAIREDDLLVHHPYESFQHSAQRFVEEAADDPDVLAIKQTLYRTSDNSPIVAALVNAAEKGKQVAVLVEVKARFDEANNIEWGRMLEESGVHVAYGLVGLKTHAKTTLVIRQEEDGPRTYCHIGTGNYNSTTARLYTDLGLLTCDRDIGYDVTHLFHYLTGYAPHQEYRELLVAPTNMRRRFEELIQREIDIQRDGGTGRIVAKMNALNDTGIIRELYRASQAGVQIDLIVRGHCRMRPGLEHFSENVRVISILGRFLEHTRVYYFGNGGDPEVFMGSADWMSRNLNSRVEAIVPVRHSLLKARIVEILDLALSDHRSAWELHPDGRYVQRTPQTPEHEGSSLQDQLIERARTRIETAYNPS